MSRDLFTREIEAKGWKVNYIHWEPIVYKSRDGREGGWEIHLKEDNEDDIIDSGLVPILGYNKKEVLGSIEKLPVNPLIVKK